MTPSKRRRDLDDRLEDPGQLPESQSSIRELQEFSRNQGASLFSPSPITVNTTFRTIEERGRRIISSFCTLSFPPLCYPTQDQIQHFGQQPWNFVAWLSFNVLSCDIESTILDVRFEERPREGAKVHALQAPCRLQNTSVQNWRSASQRIGR